MARVTVSLPDAMLEKLDSLAERDGLSRSDVVREASARYLTTCDEEAQAQAREQAVREGLEYLADLAQLPALDDRSTLDVLREMRRTDDSAPLRDGFTREGTE